MLCQKSKVLVIIQVNITAMQIFQLCLVIGNTNMLSDYAAIKNGSYGKLMKAYYAKQDAEKLSGKGDTSQKLTLMKTSADSLTKSADALNDSSLWEKKKIKKKDEKTGEEIETEDYDWNDRQKQ